MKFPKFNIKKKSNSAQNTNGAEAAGIQPATNTVPETTPNEDFMPHEGEPEPVVQDSSNESEEGKTDAEQISDVAPTASDDISSDKGEPKPNQEVTSVISEKISINTVFACIWRNKWKYILPLICTAAFVSWIALSIPRYYKVTVMLAPEYNIPSGGTASFSGLASQLGINVGSTTGTDAIVPMFYPDLIGSTDFLVPLFKVPVTTKDGKFQGSYSEFIKKQKAPWWTVEINKLKNRIAPPPKNEPRGEGEQINPFALNVEEDAIMRAIKSSINCTVDKKTDVITLTTTAQDPLVAALIADTVRVRLQDFITDYRTVKARRDLKHIQSLCERAHKDYLKKQQEYATFVDANQDLVLETFKAKEKDLEDEMQLAFNTYSQLQARMQSAEAKVEERTPAFTVLQNASVPVKHDGPKRVFMVLGALVLAFIITTIVIISRDKRVRW